MFTEKTNPHVSKPTQFNPLCKGQLYLGVWVCICMHVCVCVGSSPPPWMIQRLEM